MKKKGKKLPNLLSAKRADVQSPEKITPTTSGPSTTPDAEAVEKSRGEPVATAESINSKKSKKKKDKKKKKVSVEGVSAARLASYDL